MCRRARRITMASTSFDPFGKLRSCNARAIKLNSFNGTLFYAMKSKSIERAVACLLNVMQHARRHNHK